MEKVTIGVVNYNGQEVLPETIRALKDSDYHEFEVLVVDNHSTDGSREWLQQHHPEIRCICLEENIGPPGARNVILREALTEYTLMIDNDIHLEPDTLARLMQVMRSVPDAGVCHPEIQDHGDPAAYHYNGGWIHYLCASVSRPRPNTAGERPLCERFDAISGAALLLRKQVAAKIGGFDADYFFNWEDGDFTSRLTLAGYQCLNVPNAVVQHRGKARGTSKAFYMVRNRWYFVLKLYSWRTIIFAAPMLLLFELSQAFLLLRNGSARDWWEGTKAAFSQLPRILEKRRAFQKLKIKRDREWLRSGEIYVPGQLSQGSMAKRLLRLLYASFDLYWRVIRPLC